MNKKVIFNELVFKATRSSGAGGQHVNKVASRVELYFNILESEGLHESQKILLLKRLHTKISKQGVLSMSCQDGRSQHKNKQILIDNFFKLLLKSTLIQKPRKKTKPSFSARKKRLDHKKKQSEKKNSRKKFSF